MRCQVCLQGDDDHTGEKVKRYRAVIDTDLGGGYYHEWCALMVGYNEWDEEES